MNDPFRGEIHEKSDASDAYYSKTYETDDYESVSDAIQDVVYQLEQDKTDISEEVTQVIIIETDD